MALTSYNIQLDSRDDRNGQRAVMIRIHQKDQKPAFILTGIKIENAPKYWAALDKKRKITARDRKRWVVKHPDADRINADIERESERIIDQMKAWQQESNSTLTPRQLADRYKNPVSERYKDLTDQVLEEAKAQAFRTWRIKSTAVQTLLTYAGEGLLLQDVTVPFVEAFQKYLKIKYVSSRTGRKLKPSSINQYFESLSTVHKEILKIQGHAKKKAALLCPFSEVEPLPAKSTYRSKFNETEIETIGKKLEDDRSGRRIDADEAFSLWMASHLLAGMRFSDLLMLRYRHFTLDQNGDPVHLTYTMSKTGNHVSMPLHEEARAILSRWWRRGEVDDEYVLPYLDSSAPYAEYKSREQLYEAPFEIRRVLDTRLHYWNGRINKALARIQKSGNLKGDLRMHNARHSFADRARRIMQEDGTLSPLDITLMMGQSDFRMTMKYIEELDKQDSSKPINAVFNRKAPIRTPD